MRTTEDDLTAPARIRAAATRLYAQRGFDVGLRAIAEEAGVSLGLIRHHFGSKDGLRAACDDAVLAEIGELQTAYSHVDQPATSLMEQLASLDDYEPLVQYIIRALTAGGAPARRFWDRMVTDAETYLGAATAAGVVRPSVDDAARARFLTLVELGGLVLAQALAPDDDFSTTWERYVETVTGPALEIYTQGLLTDTSLLDAYLEQSKRNKKGS